MDEEDEENIQPTDGTKILKIKGNKIMYSEWPFKLQFKPMYFDGRKQVLKDTVDYLEYPIEMNMDIECSPTCMAILGDEALFVLHFDCNGHHNHTWSESLIEKIKKLKLLTFSQLLQTNDPRYRNYAIANEIHINIDIPMFYGICDMVGGRWTPGRSVTPRPVHEAQAAFMTNKIRNGTLILVNRAGNALLDLKHSTNTDIEKACRWALNEFHIKEWRQTRSNKEAQKSVEYLDLQYETSVPENYQDLIRRFY